MNPSRAFASFALAVLAASALGCGSDESGNTEPQGQGNDAAPDDVSQPDVSQPDAETDAAEASLDAGLDAVDEVSTDGPSGPTFVLEQEFTIASVSSGHLAFPDVTRLSDGRLLLVYRRGASHVDSTGRIMKQFGSADGLTWTSPEVLYDEPGMDDRDPSVATLSNGDLLVTYFQYHRVAFPDGTLAVHHCFAGRSHDDGASFGAFVQVDPGEMNPSNAVLDGTGNWVDGDGNPVVVQGCSSAVVEWQGKVVLPTYGGQSLNLADMAGSPKSRVYLYESSDWGDSWTGGVVAADKATTHWLEEPALLVLDDQSVLMHLRTALGASPGNSGMMMQVRWDGDTAAWSDVTPFKFVGHAPELAQLANGMVLSGFREINALYTMEWVSFVASMDRGATWSDPIRVKACGASECGYPAIEALGPDRFLFVYYGPGGKAIEGAIFKVELL